jgi:sugar (pentulose or hexulose) kinase
MFEYEQIGGMDSTIALGLDIGSTNTKAVVAEFAGPAAIAGPAELAGPIVLAEASIPTPIDGDRLVADVETLVARVLAAAGRVPACVGVASMAESGVPLGADGRPLAPILRWDGRRDAAPLAALANRMPPHELFAATGVRLSGKVPLAMWAGLAAEQPDVFSALHRWAGVADLVALAMTGELVTDHTLAARTGAYRLAGAAGGTASAPPFVPDSAAVALEPPPSFDPELLALVGLAPAQLPAIRRPGDDWPIVGTRGFAGLSAGTPVVIAGHDHPVGARLAGARAGDLVDSLGTAEAVFAPLLGLPGAEDIDRIREAGFSLVPTIRGDGLALLGGSPSAGAMVAWWREEVLGGAEADDVFARAGALLPAASGFTVLPYLRGRQCPLPDPAAGVLMLPERPATDAERIEATLGLFEGLAFQARWMTDAALALAGIVPARILALGGPVEDVPWFALKAALSPAPLHRVELDQPVAVGAAVVAAERSGLLEDPPAVPTRAVEPASGDYEHRYRDFVALAVSRTKNTRKGSTAS